MAPKAETKPESKAPAKAAAKGKAEKTGDKKKKGGKPKGTESYKIYIFKVLKQVHPDTGISSKVGLLIITSVAKVGSCMPWLFKVILSWMTGQQHDGWLPAWHWGTTVVLITFCTRLPAAGHGHSQLLHR